MEEKKIDLTIILPTFNEKNNVCPILKEIKKVMAEKEVSYEILFMDDSSDETPQEIEKQKNNFLSLNIRLIHRPKERRTGLATAFIEGFDQAKGAYICCLDSDLQHPPVVIPKLFHQALAERADLVVATRYAHGGSAEGLGKLTTFYGFYRRLISLGCKYFTQILFIPTRQTSDPLGGFFLFKKEILADAKLYPKGFKILVEILMRANYKKISEVSYRFLARENDTSKATLNQGLEFLKHLLYIAKTAPEANRFFKFCLVGLSGFFINLGFLFWLVEFQETNLKLAWLGGVILSILTNLILNIFLVYKKEIAVNSKSLYRLIAYHLLSFFSNIFNYLVFISLIGLELHYLIAAFFSAATSIIINFFLITKIIWKF